MRQSDLLVSEMGMLFVFMVEPQARDINLKMTYWKVKSNILKTSEILYWKPAPLPQHGAPHCRSARSSISSVFFPYHAFFV